MPPRRVWIHPVLGKLEPRKVIRFKYCQSGECRELEAIEGDSIASALLANNVKVFKYSERFRLPQTVFCAIGLCTSCIMTVNGVPNVRTCITPVKEGIVVKPPGE